MASSPLDVAGRLRATSSLAGATIAGRDWAATPLGPMASWPQSLRTALALVLRSPVPMALLWGEAGVMLYNDGYAAIAGTRHPGLLGLPVRAGWPEAAAFNDRVMRVVLGGETLSFRDLELTLDRPGRPGQAWMDLDYSPVPGDDGRPAGVLAVVAETTGRVLAGRRLADERERLLRSFEQAPGFIVSLQGPGHVVEFVNAAHRRLFSSGDWVGRPLREAFPDIEGQGFLDCLDEVFATGERFVARAAPAWFRQADGRHEERVLSFVYEPVRDAEGEVVGVLCEGADVTEAHWAQEALRQREERLRLVVDGAADHAILTLDLERRITSWSAGAEAIFGYAPEEILGQAADVLFTPEDRAAGAPEWEAETARRAGVAPDVRWHLRRDGGLAFLNGSLRALHDGEGRLSGFLKVARDETAAHGQSEELARTREALADSEAKFQAIANSIDPMVWSARPDGFHDYYNDRWYEFTGTPPGSTDGEGWAGVFHPDDQPLAWGLWRHSLETGEPYRIEYRLRHRSGLYRWVLGRAQCVRDAHGRITRWFGTCTDIEDIVAAREVLARSREDLEAQVAERTAALQAEMARRGEAEAALRQSQKMEAVGQLTGGIAHDFNNLLTGISGSLELLETRLAQGRADEAGRYLAAAQGAATRAAALTHRLLAFSRRQPLDPRPTDANRLIADMEELIRRSAGPGIALEVVAAPELWPTLVDPNQLENALLNLCINARDAMPGGGRLLVETANRPLDAGPARALDLEPGDYVAIDVSDTGTGMSAEVAARAFDPFFTTKPLGQGTGLGLSMIYGFARQSGGQARIHSEPGRGTTVSLLLPRHLGAAEEPAPDPEPGGPWRDLRARDGETVLVVDDEPTVRLLVLEALGDLGYRTVEAADGPEAVAALRSPARVDLLVTDLGLPGGMSGREVAEAGRALRPGLGVLFVTGYAGAAAGGHGPLGPGMRVLAKPFAVEALAACVREVLDG